MPNAARHRSIGLQHATYWDECLARFRVLINDLLRNVGQDFTIDLDDAVTAAGRPARRPGPTCGRCT